MSMTRSVAPAAVLLLLLAAASRLPAAAKQTPAPGVAGSDTVRRPPVQPDGMITGRVVIAGTTTPIRGAEVRVRATNGRENRLVTTDAQGRYEVRDLLPDTWSITVSKAGFISQQYGQRRPFEAVKPIELGARGRVVADLELIRGGAISGRVYDEFGDPIAGARVQVLRQRVNAQGRKELTATGVSDQTDDTGAFRVFALPPGAYYVTAAPRTGAADTSVIDIVATAPTYYPGTPSLAEAQRVLLGAGEEQANISFQLTPLRAVRVSGTLLTSTGAPAAMAQVTLRSTTDTGPMTFAVGNYGIVRSNGAFTVANVPPGSYLLTAQSQSDTGIPAPDLREYASVPVTIGSQDLEGLTVVMTKGAAATIGVVAEPPSALPARLALQISATSGRGMTMMNGRQAGVRTFALSGLEPDRWTFGINGLPDDWAVKSIDVNGSDVSDDAVEMKGGEQTIVSIVVTDRITDLQGTVTAGGQPALNVPVVVFPEDPARWTAQSRYVRTVRTDETGRYRIRGLPPDSRYLAVAVDYLEDGESRDPEVLERLKSVATAVSLGNAERKTINLRLTTR